MDERAPLLPVSISTAARLSVPRSLSDTRGDMVHFPLDFIKMSGAGNDFIVADNRTGQWNAWPLPQLARRLCSRGVSVGADGLILIEPSKRARFLMRHFNPDGSEPDLCGNGVRCAVRFALQKVIGGRQMTVETRAGVIPAEVLPDNRVRLDLPFKPSPPQYFRLGFRGKEIPGYLTVSGVPHFVLFVTGVEEAPVSSLGPVIRSHPDLGSDGANVDFVRKEPIGGIYPMRTFERGVERETLACGTGAMAVAWILHHLGDRPASVVLRAASGETLRVSFPKSQLPTETILEGGASLVYQGRLSEEELIGVEA